MLRRITKLFTGNTTESKELQITAEVDVVDGLHRVVFKKHYPDGSVSKIENPETLMAYGYHEYDETTGTLYTVSSEDRRMLNAIWAMKDRHVDNDAIVFRVRPRIMQYVRTQFHNIVESENARRVIISDKPMRLKAHVDFDENQGLTVRFDANHEQHQDRETSTETMGEVIDGYVRYGDTFVSLEHRLDPEIETLVAQQEVQIDEDDIPSFYTEKMETLHENFDVELSEAAAAVTVDATPLQATAKVDYRNDQGLNVKVGYEDESSEFTLWKDLKTVANGTYARFGNRFRRVEEPKDTAAQLLLRKGNIDVPKQRVPDFFQNDFVILTSNFSAVLTESAQELQLIDVSTPRLQLKVTGTDKGWLDFDVGYVINGHLVPIRDLLRRGADNYHQVDDTTWVRASADELEKIQSSLKASGVSGTPTTGYKVRVDEFDSIQEFIEILGGESELDTAYESFLDDLTDLKRDPEYQLLPAIEQHLLTQGIELRPYQRAGIDWLMWLHENQLHGILADDMGLGKTLQTICAISQAYEQTGRKQHSLIIAPKSVMHHWMRELARFFPGVPAIRHHGTSRNMQLFAMDKPFIFVSTYDTVANDIEDLKRIPFFYLILDEASYIKNTDTKRTRQIKRLNAGHRLALTGTPVENRPSELWSIFDFIMKGYLGSLKRFIDSYEKPIISGNQQVATNLARKISPFILRRTKNQVARDLPDKITVTEWCELSDEQKSIYKAIQASAKDVRDNLAAGGRIDYTHIFTILTKLLQLCDHPALLEPHTPASLDKIRGRSEKFDLIATHTIETVRNGEQIVIFSRFLRMLDLLERIVEEAGFRFIRIDGSTNNREKLIDSFNNNHAPVALCSTLAAGYGINLTAGNHVIHADLWWNPASEDQATDRVHRIGQTKTVSVYRFLNENTLEERLDALLDTKRTISSSIIDVATMRQSEWGREELLQLLDSFN